MLVQAGRSERMGGEKGLCGHKQERKTDGRSTEQRAAQTGSFIPASSLILLAPGFLSAVYGCAYDG